MSEVDDLRAEVVASRIAEDDRLRRELDEAKRLLASSRAGFRVATEQVEGLQKRAYDEHARAERLEARAGEFADFIGRVSTTMPRDSRIAAEARDLLRDGLYGTTAEEVESNRAERLTGALRERDETEKMVEALHQRGWTKHDHTVLTAKAPRRIVLISPPYQANLIEIVVAKWSTPSLAAKERLEEWFKKSKWEGALVVHDADEFSDPPHTQGRGECRLNGGPWMPVEDLLEKLNAALEEDDAD